MPDNISDSKKTTELKLLKLYAEHSLTSLKIIEILGYILSAIDEGDAVKLENYSLIEKELINNLVNIKKVVAGFEKNCFVYSVELDKYRVQAIAQENIIMIRGKKNRNTLKLYLEKISTQIDILSKKMLYSAPFSRQTAPQFVDLSI